MEKKKIKVIIVVNDFLIGGAQRLIIGLLQHFNRDRFDLVFVTLMQFEGRDTMYNLLPKDIPVYKFNFNGFADAASWISFGKFLKKERPDVVFSHLFFSNTIVRFLNIFIGYRTITVEHNTYVGNKQWQIWCDRLLSRLSRKIVAVSPVVREFASRQQRVKLEKFVLIRNGIDVRTLSQKSASVDVLNVKRELRVPLSSKLIIAVGRLTGQKDPLLMVEGFARFVRIHSEYHLVILGDGSLRGEMQERAKELGVAESVHFLGNVQDVIKYYAAAEFLISTSLIEGLSMAHLEALACRLPLLATRTAGSEELVEDGKNGFFITENTPEAVESGLVRINQADIKLLREQAYDVAKRYDILTSASQYEKLFLDIVEHG